MKPRILITGGTGFVGRQVVKNLAGKDVDLILVVRPDKQAKAASVPGVEHVVVTADAFAESAEWWTEACAGSDIVIHIAWYVEPGKYLQSEKNLACLQGTLNLAKGAAAAGTRRWLGIGTCFEYDLAPGILSTDTPLKPLTPYAAAKAAAYLALSQWLPAQGVEFAWCRLFYLFGEGEDERRLVPYLRKRLSAGEMAELTSGDQVRDFLDVAEAGRSIAELALGDQSGPINVCSGRAITVRQLAEAIADEYGRRDLLGFGLRPDNHTDPPCVVGEKSGQ